MGFQLMFATTRNGASSIDCQTPTPAATLLQPMEELLVILCQFFFEVVLQVLAELPWELITSNRKPPNPNGPALWVILSLLAGAGVGGLSLIFFPTTLLHSPTARLDNLLVAPALSAFASFSFATFRPTLAPNPSNPKSRALYAACFTFALAIIRFTYATRPRR